MFKKFSWGHGIALALASFIIFILYMVIYFGNGMKNAEMVSDNYYDDELNYQQVIDAKSNAEKLAVKPIYLQNQSGITITFPKEITPDNKKASFVLYRTDDANLDIKKEMQLDANNSFNIPSKILSKGSYTLMLKWQIEKKKYQLDYSVLWK
jgi:hypothetical protein